MNETQFIEKYLASEVEYQRRKWKRKYDELSFMVAKHNDELLEYLQSRGLLEDYINYIKVKRNDQR